MLTAKYSAHTCRDSRGFTLVELAVVVTIIGILAAIAIPYYRIQTESAAISRLEHDLRLFEQEFDTYELENGILPPSQPIAGLFPIDMEGRLSQAWKNLSPIGGVYRWVYTTEVDPNDRIAYIEIVHTPTAKLKIDSSRLIEIDEDLDDGDINTGRVLLFGTNVRYLVR